MVINNLATIASGLVVQQDFLGAELGPGHEIRDRADFGQRDGAVPEPEGSRSRRSGSALT